MRKLSFIFASLLLVVTMYAQDLKAIKLSSPDKNRGSSIMKALSDRHSDREYAAKELSLQDLSDLLWAANGINRPAVRILSNQPQSAWYSFPIFHASETLPTTPN